MLVSASDPVAAALSTALDGLALRQRVAANNVANIDTPGFTAATLDFEGNLRAAMADGSLDENGVLPTVGTSTAQPGANGNNVDLATETMTAMQAGFQYQLLSRAISDRYTLVTTAIGGM